MIFAFDSLTEVPDRTAEFGANFADASNAKDQDDNNKNDDQFSGTKTQGHGLALLFMGWSGIFLFWILFCEHFPKHRDYTIQRSFQTNLRA
jgi:hypothetical protein